MAKQNTKEQIITIEEQIKKLKEKQKRILTNTQREIGKYVMESWAVEDVHEAKKLIDSLKEQVRSINEAASSKEAKDERNHVSLHQPVGDEND
jgi:septation ring formation regulator EzrA